MPKQDGYKHGAPSWVDLATTDIEAAKTFYTGLFCWEWTGADMPGGSTYWMALLGDELVAGLAQQPPQMAEHGVPSMWNTYVNVDSVDETIAKAESAGAKVIAAPMDVGAAGRMAFAMDTSGAAIGMWQAGQHTGAGVRGETGAVVWNGVFTPDSHATASFYGAVFGWESGSMDMPGGGTYTLFKIGDDPVAGTMPPPVDGVPPQWHTWFGSADVPAMVAMAEELGATVLMAPTDTPMGPVATMQDPTGGAFSITDRSSAR